MAYAEKTTVTPSKTQAEIQDLLEKYRCQNYAFARQDNRVVVLFEMAERRVRFSLPLPGRNEFKTTETGKARTATAIDTAYDQEVRRRWRALLLTIKAKLESVQSGIETFEEAFMAQLVLPGGQTMAEWAVPQIAQVYQQGGQMPPLLGSGGE